MYGDVRKIIGKWRSLEFSPALEAGDRGFKSPLPDSLKLMHFLRVRRCYIRVWCVAPNKDTPRDCNMVIINLRVWKFLYFNYGGVYGPETQAQEGQGKKPQERVALVVPQGILEVVW